ncbi:uncharacterized protein [Montipora foliosa]|uniref:uncharacterized protein n=1 Tax=Montipora foliosa TaxID=591990 RepID=UPI0035F19A8F
MAYNSQDLKVVSIFQLVMTAVFLILGLVDRFEVRYLYTSFLMAPFWTAAIVLPVGIVGLVLSRMSRRPPNLIYALKSVSVACAVMSAATMYHYQWGISILVYHKAGYPFHFVEKDTEFNFTRQENIMLAISSLAILFSIIEMILAFASAKSCGDTGYEPPQDNQVVYPFRQLGTGQIQLQPPQPTHPMVAGQAVIAGQQMVAGQPMVACQPLIAGQAVVAGQQMVAGQPLVAGQQMVYDQKMVSAQSSV